MKKNNFPFNEAEKLKFIFLTFFKMEKLIKKKINRVLNENVVTTSINFRPDVNTCKKEHREEGAE